MRTQRTSATAALRVAALLAAVWTVGLLLGAHPADAQTAIRLSDQIEPLTQPTLPVWPETNGRGESWREDPDRLKRKWDMMPSPTQYRDALRSTGMADHFATGRVARGGSGWQPLGPIGSYGASKRNGRISNIEILSDGPTYSIYVGACQGGLWVASSSGADSWTDLSVNLPHYACRAFNVRPSNHDDIVVATGEFQRSKGAGVYRTTNGGATWVASSLSGSTPASCYRIGRKLDDESVLLLASNKGLLRSTDTGATWSPALLSGGGEMSGHWTDLLLHPTQPDIMYAGRWNVGLHRSTDGGATWSPFGTGLPTGEAWDHTSLALCAGANDVMAVVMEDITEAITGVYRSTDAGSNWTNVTNGLTGSQAFHTLSLAIDPTDCDVMYVGLADLHVTTDAGATWQGSSGHSIEKGHADIARLYFSAIAGNEYLFLGTDGGIYVHDLILGQTLPLLGNSSTGLQCSEMDFHAADRGVRTAGLQDNGIVRSTNAGQTWEAIASADGADTEIVNPETGEFWYGAGVFSPAPSWRVFRQPASGSPTFTNNPDKSQMRLYHDAWSSTMYMCSGEALWSTSSSGTPNWTSQLSGFQTSPYTVRTLDGTPVDGSTIWVNYWGAADNGRDLTMLKKVAGSWTVAQHHELLNPTEGTILSVTPSPSWPDECWVAMAGDVGASKILHTRDGVTFDDWTGNLSMATQVWSVAVPPFRPREAYAGTDFGVFRTTDGGTTWTPFQSGLPAARCRTLSWVVDDSMQGQDRLVVATDGRGMWNRVVTSPPIIYVDSRSTGVQDGTWEAPFDEIDEGLGAAPPGSIVAVRGDTYLEPAVIPGGQVTIVSYFERAIID